jgi:hypothetical protein
VEGQNIVIEDRWADGRSERFPVLIAELIRLRVDVIVPAPSPAPSPRRSRRVLSQWCSGVSATPWGLGSSQAWGGPAASRVGGGNRSLGSVGAKAEWLSYPTTTAGVRSIVNLCVNRMSRRPLYSPASHPPPSGQPNQAGTQEQHAGWLRDSAAASSESQIIEFPKHRDSKKSSNETG